ncbi:hypothetical protein H5T51_09505 [Candidatus Bathyarchaeota archaeon]|nr:hypothetical protein [Candidatus Bathyarchaeota archaeon]
MAIAEEVGKRTGAACLPVIPFGVSYHHSSFGELYVFLHGS